MLYTPGGSQQSILNEVVFCVSLLFSRRQLHSSSAHQSSSSFVGVGALEKCTHGYRCCSCTPFPAGDSRSRVHCFGRRGRSRVLLCSPVRDHRTTCKSSSLCLCSRAGSFIGASSCSIVGVGAFEEKHTAWIGAVVAPLCQLGQQE